MKAPLEIAHFGTEPIQQAELEWKVATADGKLLKQESLSVSVPLGNAVQIGEISLDLSEIKEASKLVVSAVVTAGMSLSIRLKNGMKIQKYILQKNWTAVHAKNLAGENPYCGYRMMLYSP